MSVVSGQSNGTVEVTPSGIPVYYQSQPKRLYRIAYAMPASFPVKASELQLAVLLEMAQEPDSNWREVPSVTTVLGVLDKPALPWWGMKCGVAGMVEMARQGNIELNQYLLRCHSAETAATLTDEFVELLTEHKLTVNHIRDKAGDRGQAVHDALENWARYGHRPDPSIHPEEQEGYVRGLLAFLDDVPSAEPEGAEVLVASVEYGYAGRYDLRLRTSLPHEVVVRRTKTKVRRRTLAPGRLLCDLKTSKSAYPTQALQLSAYEQASIESGYEPTDGRGILLVSPEGHYEFKRASAQVEDFLAVLNVWQRMQNKGDWL